MLTRSRPFQNYEDMAWTPHRGREAELPRHAAGDGATPLALALALLLGAASLWAGGFATYLSRIPLAPLAEVPAADGIVVLTGGARRLDEALALLEAGKGERLLISGVNPTATRADLAALVDPALGGRFECCVDLDYVATSTIGNAAETARWADRHGYRRLLVVTAAYHMPRSLFELGTQMPGVALVGVPVFPDATSGPGSWRTPVALRLLATEYTKYLAALLRVRFG